MQRESRIIATAFALTAFSVAVICGLASGNSPLSILFHALLVTIICQFIGLVAAEVLAYAARSHVQSRNAAREAAASTEPASGSAGPTPGGGGKTV